MDGSLLTHFLQRVNKDIERIESLIQVVHNDVNFLLEANQIHADDAALILSKVPASVSTSQQQPVGRHAPLSRSRVSLESNDSAPLGDLNSADSLAPPSYSYPSMENVINNVPRSQPKRQARALWDYNLDGEEPEDLAFEKGAIIEVIKENNEDWWTGKCNGRTGIFPSNYCEVLQYPLPSWSQVPPATATKPRPIPETAPKYVPYKHASPPDHGSRPTAQDDDLKKHKYSHSKNTSTGTGLGYGAGAPNPVVRAIF